ncbi:ATP-binding protein [Streptomyces sp. NPDC059378]|uniref:ATP-binding protein n=1 Tax=Streptomyces sp. NPDC059378 TaxID=3346815 RepID=UPI0036A7E84E
MDPIDREPEEYGHDGDSHAPRPRSSRDPLTPDFSQHKPTLARTAQLVTGDLLLTVNPVDGSEIEACPPGAERPGRPEKLDAAARAEAERAAQPPVPAGPAQPELPLLGRQDERERLVRLLARGRSVRLTGPAGSGRTSLLDVVAEDCTDLAPDGVVRLNGARRTASDLLYDLFHTVYDAPLHRPDRDELAGHVREIGAVVVLDDAEIGGAELDELLDATPECAFVIAATPEVPAPSAEAALEEVFLGGLDRAGGVDLIERAVGRVLTEEENNWAGDLWFESEGLPLRFVQAGALLRQRDRLRADVGAVDEFGVFEDELPDDADFDAESTEEVPLPSLAEAAAPAPLLASRLSTSARAALRFAVALGGEVPHQAHLPALVGDTHADAALGELAACGLVSPVGPRYRLAAGVLTQLEAAGYADDIEGGALTAARHYAWWAGHPSVTPGRVCAEADAVLTALAVLAPTVTPADAGEDEPGTEDHIVVRLARAAAPAFAAGMHWGAWEQALRVGTEAARTVDDVSEQAYFRHELGILALCCGEYDVARAELEAAIGLRGATADKRGTVVGRRALALVADRTGDVPGLRATAGEEVPDARSEQSASPPGGIPTVRQPLALDSTALVTYQPAADGGHKERGGLRGLARRNLVAVGAGALLVAVLGTVVTLGATSDKNDANVPSDRVGVSPSADQDLDDGSQDADQSKSGTGRTGTGTGAPSATATDPGPDGTYGTSDDPTPTGAAQPSDDPTGTKGAGGASGSPTKKPSHSPTSRPTSPRPTRSSTSPSPNPSASQTTPAPTDSPSASPSATDTTGSMASASASMTASEDAGSGTPSDTAPVI